MSGKVKGKKGSTYALGIIFNFIWMFIVYRAVLMLSEHIGSIVPYAICSCVYLIAATSLLCAYYFATSGETDAEKKNRYKSLFVWAFPIVIVLLFDVLETVVFDYIINLFA